MNISRKSLICSIFLFSLLNQSLSDRLDNAEGKLSKIHGGTMTTWLTNGRCLVPMSAFGIGSFNTHNLLFSINNINSYLSFAIDEHDPSGSLVFYTDSGYTGSFRFSWAYIPN